ncbi:MAG: exodeoxyribonuclease VII large subunit [Christensenellales bacterium]
MDAWMDGMAKQIHRAIERTETRLALYTRSGPMVQFPMKLSQYEEKTAQWQKQIEKQALHAIDKAEQRLMALTAEVYALSPQHALKKGYAILRDETGALISSVAQAEPGAVFTAYLADGTRRAAWQTEEE